MGINSSTYTDNYVSLNRNFTNGNNTSVRSIMIQPRFKFTFLVEFSINSQVWNNSVTNLQQFVKNGKIYINVKSIDLPKPHFKNEKIDQYNIGRIVTTKMEYDPASITFYDDSSSMVAALIKEYINFYHQTGVIGSTLGNQTGNSSFYSEDAKLGIDQTSSTPIINRSSSDTIQSLGMNLRTNSTRCFFHNIIVHDYGSDPDSINTYYFYNPVINDISSDGRDVTDRNGLSSYTMNFEYESYYNTVGQSRTNNELIPLEIFNPLSDLPDDPNNGYSPSIGHTIMQQASSSINNIQNNFTNSNIAGNNNLYTSIMPGESVASFQARTSGLLGTNLNFGVSSSGLSLNANSATALQYSTSIFNPDLQPNNSSVINLNASGSTGISAGLSIAGVTANIGSNGFGVAINPTYIASQVNNLISQNSGIQTNIEAVGTPSNSDESNYVDSLQTQYNQNNTNIINYNNQFNSVIQNPSTNSASLNTLLNQTGGLY